MTRSPLPGGYTAVRRRRVAIARRLLVAVAIAALVLFLALLAWVPIARASIADPPVTCRLLGHAERGDTAFLELACVRRRPC